MSQSPSRIDVSFVKLEQTPLNCGQQLPAQYKRLIDGLEKN